MEGFAAQLADRLQDVAIRFKTWRGTDAELVKLVALPGVTTSDMESSFNRQDLQDELYRLRDVAFWRGADHRWRLIDQQPPDSPSQALKFLMTPTVGMVCRFCRMEDIAIELLNDGPGSHIHPHCRRPWFRWYRMSLMETRKHRAPAPQSWWQVLGLEHPNASKKEIEKAYKVAAQKAHPDRGGTDELMQQISGARAEALLNKNRRVAR